MWLPQGRESVQRTRAGTPSSETHLPDLYVRWKGVCSPLPNIEGPSLGCTAPPHAFKNQGERGISAARGVQLSAERVKFGFVGPSAWSPLSSRPLFNVRVEGLLDTRVPLSQACPSP